MKRLASLSSFLPLFRFIFYPALVHAFAVQSFFLETPLFIKLLIWVFLPRFVRMFSSSALNLMNLLLWQTYPN